MGTPAGNFEERLPLGSPLITTTLSCTGKSFWDSGKLKLLVLP